MSALDLSARTARRELGALVEAADDHDLIAAFARAVWSVLVEPGDRVAGALVLALGPAAALETVVAQSPGGLTVAGSEAAERAGLTGHELAQGCGRWMPRLGGAESALAIARRAGVQLITPEDTAWPVRVDDLGPHAPLCLWVRGDPAVLSAPPRADWHVAELNLAL